MKLTSAQSSIVVVTLRIAGVICQAVAFVVLVNALPAREFGIFSVLYVFWGLVRMLGPFGLDNIILRDVAGARATGHAAHAVALSRRGLRAAGLGGLGLMLVTAPALALVNAAAAGGLSALEIVLVAGAVPAFTVMGVLAASLRGFDRNVISQGIESFGLHLVVLILFTACMAFGRLGLDAALACMAAAAIAAVLVYAAALLPLLAATPAAPLTPQAWREVRAQAFEVWQALLLIGLAGRAPNYISLMLLGPVPTALLEVAMRFGTLPTIFTTGVSVTFQPVFAGLHVRNEREAFSEALAVGSWLAFVPAACVLAATLLCGQWFLDLFFPALYRDAYIPLLVIVASCALNAAYGLSSPILLVTGCQRLVRTYSAFRLATVAGTGVVLGLWLGVTGIALSFLLGVVVFDLGLAKQIAPQLNVSGFLRPHGLQALFKTLKVTGKVAEKVTR